MAYGQYNDSGYNYDPYGGGWNEMPGDAMYSGPGNRDSGQNYDPAETSEPEIATENDYWTRSLYGQFQGPQMPGSYGSFGDSPGGRGMVSAVGEFQPGAGFQSPVGATQYEQFQAPSQFQAPTMEQVQATPGYEFRRREGEQAIENAAAAQGIGRTGGAMKDLMRYGQDYATGEYDKAYGRALGENQMGYQRALGENQMGYQRAQQANQDQYGRALGEYQMGYGQRGDVYDARMQRAMAEARMGETGAGRQMARDRLNYESNMRRYDDQYRRSLGEHRMGRDEARWDDAREWDRYAMYPAQQRAVAEGTLGG